MTAKMESGLGRYMEVVVSTKTAESRLRMLHLVGA